MSRFHGMARVGLAVLCLGSAANLWAQATPGGGSGSSAASGSGAGGQRSDAQIAAWLRVGNEAEVTLGQFASQRASSDEVKQFAKQMVKEHTDMLSQLAKFEGQGAGASGRGSSTGGSGSGGASATSGSGASGQSGRSGAGGSSAQGGAGATSTGGGAGSSDATGSASTTGQSGAGGSGSGGASGSGSATSGSGAGGSGAGASGSSAGGSGAGAGAGGASSSTGSDSNSGQGTQSRTSLSSEVGMGQAGGRVDWLQVKQEIGQRCLSQTQEELSKKQGAEFDKAYVAQQVVQHVEMVATLQVLRDRASSEMQQVIAQGEKTAQQHLDHAKQLKQSLDSGSGAHSSKADHSTSGSKQGGDKSSQ